ncbi:hypothetical protein DPMN_114841 [Dreissena polymorpha]|uniref:Uncharacterized protein n=1 Tax=Dreissena polymorpha TaxID=45954 RepID=A0A9D4QSV5_DREPO|nr:hypothetical protein DPMN_114841 [Dreissena polymorpha]
MTCARDSYDVRTRELTRELHNLHAELPFLALTCFRRARDCLHAMVMMYITYKVA